jgi:MFS family permease
LAAGAVPALAILYFRRKMPETARYLSRLAGDTRQAADVMRQISGKDVGAPGHDDRPFWTVFARHAGPILSAALLWMLYDLVVYAIILFGPSLIGKSLGLTPVAFSLLLQTLFVLPASVLMSVFLIDKVGRKPLQAWGFLVGGVLVTLFGLMQKELLTMPILAFVVFGLFNVAETGPGLVSGAGILGVELAPTRVRSVAQSLTVAGGRIGAAIAGFGFPWLFGHIGQAFAYYVIAGIAVAGAVCTWTLVPETGRISLEEITSDGAPVPAAAS